MRTTITRGLATAATLLATTGAALAHGAHGAVGDHWHASDAWGFFSVLALATLAIWLSRGDN